RGVLREDGLLAGGRGGDVVREGRPGLHQALGRRHAFEDLLGDVVAAGVLLHRDGDELAAGGGGGDAAVLTGDLHDAGREVRLRGAVDLPGAVLGEGEL